MNLTHLIVLGALEHVERGSGYDLDRFLQEQRIREWTEVKRASIYHALKALEIAGHVAVVDTVQMKGYPEKTIYAATPAGRERFDELQRKAALGLFPRFLGFKLALKLNKRATPAQLGKLADAAIARLVALEEKLAASVAAAAAPMIAAADDDEEQRRARRELDAFYDEHDRLLFAAERAWIEAAKARFAADPDENAT